MLATVAAECSRGPGVPQPDENAAMLVTRQVLGVDEFNLEVLDRLVIELELPLERAIGHTPPLAQQGDHLIHHPRQNPLSFPPCVLISLLAS